MKYKFIKKIIKFRCLGTNINIYANIEFLFHYILCMYKKYIYNMLDIVIHQTYCKYIECQHWNNEHGIL